MDISIFFQKRNSRRKPQFNDFLLQDFFDNPTTQRKNKLFFNFSPRKIDNFLFESNYIRRLNKEQIIKYLKKIVQFYKISIKDFDKIK